MIFIFFIVSQTSFQLSPFNNPPIAFEAPTVEEKNHWIESN